MDSLHQRCNFPLKKYFLKTNAPELVFMRVSKRNYKQVVRVIIYSVVSANIVAQVSHNSSQHVINGVPTQGEKETRAATVTTNCCFVTPPMNPLLLHQQSPAPQLCPPLLYSIYVQCTCLHIQEGFKKMLGRQLQTGWLLCHRPAWQEHFIATFARLLLHAGS